MEWWEFLLVMALVLPVLVLWLGCIIDAISRPDLGGLAKAGWVLFIILLPIIGSLVYIIVRPRMIVAPASETDQVWGSSPDSLPTSSERGSNLI